MLARKIKGLIAPALVTGVIFIATFARRAGLPVRITLTGTSLLLETWNNTVHLN